MYQLGPLTWWTAVRMTRQRSMKRIVSHRKRAIKWTAEVGYDHGGNSQPYLNHMEINQHISSLGLENELRLHPWIWDMVSNNQMGCPHISQLLPQCQWFQVWNLIFFRLRFTSGVPWYGWSWSSVVWWVSMALVTVTVIHIVVLIMIIIGLLLLLLFVTTMTIYVLYVYINT